MTASLPENGVARPLAQGRGISRWLAASLGGLLLAALAACNGSAVVTLTSTPSTDTFLAYRVGLVSVQLQTSNGRNSVECCCRLGTTVDLARLVNLSEVVSSLVVGEDRHFQAGRGHARLQLGADHLRQRHTRGRGADAAGRERSGAWSSDAHAAARPVQPDEHCGQKHHAPQPRLQSGRVQCRQSDREDSVRDAADGGQLGSHRHQDGAHSRADRRQRQHDERLVLQRHHAIRLQHRRRRLARGHADHGSNLRDQRHSLLRHHRPYEARHP